MQDSKGYPHNNQLFVFNENCSPIKLPLVKAATSKKSSSSNESRSQKAADECRARYENSCVFCGYFDQSSRVAAHIFELSKFNCMEEKDRNKKLRHFILNTINCSSNLICLCNNCHLKFDSPYQIGIHPETHQLTVSERIREDVTQGGLAYSSLDGKVVKFDGEFMPSTELLKYRYSFFLKSEAKAKNGKRETSHSSSAHSEILHSSAYSAPPYKKAKIEIESAASGGQCNACSTSRRCRAFVPRRADAGCGTCSHLEERHCL